MSLRKRKLSASVCVVVALSGTLVWALGFELGESKKQLKLEYDVAVTDHGTGRVTAVLTIKNQGRLTPLTSVDLHIPGKQKNADGGSYADLVVSVALQESDGKQVARVHLLKELAVRAEFQLKTRHLDGKEQPLTWFYHRISLADHLKP